MVDTTRRNTLKTMVVAGSVAVLPVWAMQSKAAVFGATEIPGTVIATHLSVDFSDSVNGSQQLVTLTNSSSKAVTVRHVYPGIVNAADKRYDLNELLQHGDVVVPANGSKVFRLSVQDAQLTEQELPRGLTRSKPLRVSTIERSFNKKNPVSTTRSFFA